MTVVASGPFSSRPPGRTLAGWWRLLAPLEPLAVWVGYLFVHRLHALVRLEQFTPLDPLSQILLDVLDGELRAHSAESAVIPRLEQRLGVDVQLLLRWLRRLEGAGLITRQSSAGWELTSAGQQALEQGGLRRHQHDWRSFTFVDPRPNSGNTSQPFFLALRLPQPDWMTSWPGGKETPMDLGLLRACPGQPLEWKQQTGFPPEVAEILMPEPSHPDQEWERIIIDEPLQLCVLLCRRGSAGWQGFPLQPDGWHLDMAQPLMTIGPDQEQILPLLGVSATDFSPAEYQEAWRHWCQGRGWTAAEADSCRLEPAGIALQIQSPAELRERLAGALRSEAWLLVGSGWMRQVRKLELTAE